MARRERDVLVGSFGACEVVMDLVGNVEGDKMEASGQVVNYPKERARWRKLLGEGLNGPTPADVVVVVSGGWGDREKQLAKALVDQALLGSVLWLDGEELSEGQVMELIELAGTRYVVLAGRDVVDWWRPDLTLGKLEGDVYTWGERYIVAPVLSFETLIMRRELRRGAGSTLGALKKAMAAGGVLMVSGCVQCRGPRDHQDPDNVGWCDVHWMNGGRKAGVRAWGNVRVERAGGHIDKRGTRSMFDE